MEFSLFFTVWPWIGLGASIVLLILLFTTNFLRMDLQKPRWKDPAWLAWIGAVAYMLHNAEEYGVDLTGATLSFPKVMTDLAGFKNISEFAYLSCNLSLVWVIGPLVAYLARKRPALATCMASFELINGLSHIAQAINLRLYNPGLFISVFIFIPFGIWTLYVCLGKGHLKWSNFMGILGVGVLYHMILFLGIKLVDVGIINGFMQGMIMLLDGALTLGLWVLLGKSKKAQLAEKRI